MSELRLFNTLTRQKETFVPLHPGEVRMYSCGPTVYGPPHIGNLRTFLWSDLLRRHLQWSGLRVTQVMNITDVEDKIIRNAQAAGQDIYTYTAGHTESFLSSLQKLRIRPADAYPRATEYIPQMVALVERLAAHGHTYEADGSTYFRVSTLPGYGKLSGVQIDAESSFHRIDGDEYGKESARDFVLWKAYREGEPSWPSSVGEGRPGWHLECSAMAMDLLGETFDIHTGAVDLIFPHHENEIAQSEGATGKPFVRYWVHGEHLNIDAQKMSKSLGNIYNLAEIEEMGFDPLTLRYALLSVPYRTKLNFTRQSLEDARNALDRIETFLLRLEPLTADAGTRPEGANDEGGQLASRFLTGYSEAMNDDLNTAGALGALFTLIREANIALDNGHIGAAGAVALRDAILKTDQVLGLIPAREQNLAAEIEDLIEKRNAARKRRDFAEADRIRDGLLERGIVLDDMPQGVRWRKR